MRISRSAITAALLFVALPIVGWAQAEPNDPCAERGWRDDDDVRHCEVREETLPAGPLAVDAGTNGGVRVTGWDRNEIRVRAIVQTHARDDARARALASEIQIQTGGHRVQSTGPQPERREWWSVSYRIDVPRRSDLDLRANNGGITIGEVSGTIRFDTSNGGVRLNDVGGSVRGRTRNGGLHVTLAGQRWDGEGLDVETTNGQRLVPNGLSDHDSGRAEPSARSGHDARIRRRTRTRQDHERWTQDQSATGIVKDPKTCARNEGRACPAVRPSHDPAARQPVAGSRDRSRRPAPIP
jgi:hypothetical protein